jgi:hypothetical protein
MPGGVAGERSVMIAPYADPYSSPLLSSVIAWFNWLMR